MLDVRGIGMTRAFTCADEEFFSAYGSDYFSPAGGRMLGEPYAGRRVPDLLSVPDPRHAPGRPPVQRVRRRTDGEAGRNRIAQALGVGHRARRGWRNEFAMRPIEFIEQGLAKRRAEWPVEEQGLAAFRIKRAQPFPGCLF